MFLQKAGLISIKDGPVVSLKWANLQDAALGEVVLEGADLHETKLQRAKLHAAKLQGARLAKADLRGAGLSDARGLTEVQLTKAKSLEGATMPNGQKYGDWLKDKEGRREDGGTAALSLRKPGGGRLVTRCAPGPEVPMLEHARPKPQVSAVSRV